MTGNTADPVQGTMRPEGNIQKERVNSSDRSRTRSANKEKRGGAKKGGAGKNIILCAFLGGRMAA